MKTSTTYGSLFAKRLLVLSAAIALSAGLACATPSVGTTTWGTPGDTESWVTSPGVSLPSTSVLANPSSFLELTVDTTGELGVPPAQYVYWNNVLSVGDYSGLDLSFDFSSTMGASVDLWFVTTNSHNWYLSFTPTPVMTTYAFTLTPVETYGSWAPGGSYVFSTDLTMISQLGIRVQPAPNTGGQVYDIDNWQYYDNAPTGVPEPGVVFMLGGVLISFGLTQRKRLRDLYRQQA